jgi:hypothetical protein
MPVIHMDAYKAYYSGEATVYKLMSDRFATKEELELAGILWFKLGHNN